MQTQNTVYTSPMTADRIREATRILGTYKRSKANLEKIKEYDISVVEKEIKGIYDEVLK